MSHKHPPVPPDDAPFDADNPEWTQEMFERAQATELVLAPEVLEAFTRARGRPKSEQTKVAIKLRLDADVVERFRATGAGWQTRMNDALAAAAQALAKRA